MKILKTNTLLTDFNGKPLNDDGKDLTLGFTIASILGSKVSNPTLGWILGKKFANDEEVDLKAEEVVFLKKEINDNEFYLAIVKGQLIEMLDAPIVERKK